MTNHSQHRKCRNSYDDLGKHVNVPGTDGTARGLAEDLNRRSRHAGWYVTCGRGAQVSGPSFVQLLPRAFEDIAAKHQLSITEQYVLLRLVLKVKHETATYPCTRTELAAHLGLNRANLRRILGRLVEVGLVEESFPKGHRGWVRLPCYPQLVHESHGAKRAVRTARSLSMRTGLSRTDPEEPDDPHGAVRAITRRGTRQANRARLSISTEAVATGEVGAVVDINDAKNTPRANQAVTARETTTPTPMGAGLRTAAERVGRGSAGGGNDASPVHPRSRRDMWLTPSLRQEAPLRDPRAMGPVRYLGGTA